MGSPVQTVPSRVRDLPAGGREAATPTAEMRQVAQEFESVFIGQILHGMMESLSGSGVLGKGKDDVYATMLQDEYAKLISRSGGIGVGDAVLREMLKLQETG